jgi:hypothetical protein
MLCSLSNKLGEKELGDITRLEDELGHPLLAYSCFTAEPAQLTAGQLDKIKEMESKLGVTLVAVA